MLGVVQNLDRFEPMSVKIWNKEVGDGMGDVNWNLKFKKQHPHSTVQENEKNKNPQRKN